MIDDTKPAETPKNTIPAASGRMIEIRLVSFNVFDDGWYAIFQPKDRSAGIRMVKNVKFSAKAQMVDKSVWDNGKPGTEEAWSEAVKHRIERK